jgi:hypothetical protein
MSIETLKGLYLLETLTAPVPATITQYLKDNFATGTGPYGTFTVMDFLGTAAGANVTNLMLQVPTLINAMDVAVLQGLYNDMLATVSGTYGPNTGPVTIPAGPAAGVYATGDLAFTTGLIPAAQAEIANLIAAYPDQTNDLNSAFNTISQQIFREAVNQAKAGINYDELSSSSQGSAMSFASSLAQYGQDNTPSNSAEFLNTVAQFGTLPGQAIIGSLREGRNYQSLNEAGILSTNFAVPSTYPGESPGAIAGVLTPLPPVQPPIIPAPPAAQIPTNATSTDYTVDEARAKIASGSEPANSALSSAPPPVVPGPETTPPPSRPRIGYNPPPSVEGPNMRLRRSGSITWQGSIVIIDAEVFSGAIDSYPIGTEVPYTVTGIYLSGDGGPVDPSLITVSSVEGAAGRTVGYGLTALPPGIPLNGTFRIVRTRQGGFGVVVSSTIERDVLLTITVAGTTTYVGVIIVNQAPGVLQPEPSLDILAVYPQVTVNGVVQPGEPTTSIEIAKNFYVRVRARPSAFYITGTISVTLGNTTSALIPINYTNYSASEQGDLFLVPGSTVPATGSAVIKVTCSGGGQAPDFSGSTNVQVTPPRYPRSIGVILDGWTLSRLAPATTDEVPTGKSFTIIVTGDPNTTFNWTGFSNSGTTVTDSNGRCVFPALIAPPLSQWASNVLFRAFAGNVRDDYPITVTWPDGEVTRSTVYVSAS